jgi:hypothetical protein
MYFEQHNHISNSFLKLVKGSMLIENPDRIFEFGRLVHAAIFEPHLADKNDIDYDLACTMRDTFVKDKLCGNLMKHNGILVEHEFYRKRDGLRRRCKADAWIRSVKLIIEFKGLTVTNEPAFREAIKMFDYDMGAAFYIDTTGAESELIVAVSKKKPDRIFRYMVSRGDDIYLQGRKKYIDAIRKGVMDGLITDEHIYDFDLLNELLEHEPAV